jgi:hypothetical protein
MAFENLTAAQQAAMKKDGSHVAASARRADVIKANRETRPNVSHGTQGREPLQRSSPQPKR